MSATFIVFITVVVIAPIAMLLYTSVHQTDGSYGFANYRYVLKDGSLLDAGLHSMVISVIVTAGCVAIGVPMAFLVSRTDVFMRRTFHATAMLTFAAPSFICALGWILLLGPRNGLINKALQSLPVPMPTLNIFSPAGIAFVLVLFLYPLVMLPVAAAFQNADDSLEQAAQAVGASQRTVLRRITLPLVMPSIAAGGVVTAATSFIVFGPVALLGGPVGFETLPTAILRLAKFPPRLEAAAVLCVPTLVFLLLLLVIQKQLVGSASVAIVGGRGARKSLISLGRLRWPAFAACVAVFVLSLVLPFGILVLTSFQKILGRPIGPDNLAGFDNYVELLKHPHVVESLRNSLLLAVGAVIIAVGVSAVGVSLVARSRSLIRAAVTPLMSAPLAIPGALMAIGLILAYARPPFNLAGTLTIILIGYVVRGLPLIFQYMYAGMRQLRPELEEAARSVGASGLTTMRRVTMPLLSASVLAAALLNFVMLFRELETSIFLYSGTNPTSAVILFDLASSSKFTLMGAFSTIIIAINLIVVLLVQRLLFARKADKTA